MVVAVYGRSYLGTPGFLPAGLEGVASGLVGFLVPVVVAGRSSLGTPGFLLMGSVGRGLGLGFLGLPSGRLMPEERGGTRGLSGISSLANAGVDFWILGVGFWGVGLVGIEDWARGFLGLGTLVVGEGFFVFGDLDLGPPGGLLGGIRPVVPFLGVGDFDFLPFFALDCFFGVSTTTSVVSTSMTTTSVVSTCTSTISVVSISSTTSDWVSTCTSISSDPPIIISTFSSSAISSSTTTPSWVEVTISTSVSI